MRKQKTYFFTGVDGSTGHLFRTGNKPKRADYETLLDSVPFILDPADTAKETESGHIKAETDSRAIGRSLPAVDGFSRAVLAHQLPVVKGAIDVGDVVVSTTTVAGITIKEVTRLDGVRTRRDYVVTSALSLTSALGSVIITPIANGYNLEVNPAIVDNFKVMGAAGDLVPGYLDAKVGNGLTVNGAFHIVPVIDPAGLIIPLSVGVNGFLASLNTISTNTIQMIAGAALSANLRYNGMWFTEDAGTGLRLLPHGITQNEIALGTILGTNINANPGFFFGDGLNHDGTRMYARVHKSLQLDPTGGANIKPIELVGDLAAPGASMHYGTDGAGNKGWFTTSLFFDSPWEFANSDTSVFVKNTLSETRAPYSVATGYNSTPWIAGSIGNSSNNYTQSMNVMLSGSIAVPGTCNLNTTDSRLLWIPEDSVAFIKGTAIAQDLATNDMAVYKFSFTAKNIAGVASVSDILYDSIIAPFHVLQAGVAPYAVEYTADITPDFMIYAAGDKIRLDGFGIMGKSLRWTCELNMHINGGSTFVVPAYVP